MKWVLKSLSETGAVATDIFEVFRLSSESLVLKKEINPSSQGKYSWSNKNRALKKQSGEQEFEVETNCLIHALRQEDVQTGLITIPGRRTVTKSFELSPYVLGLLRKETLSADQTRKVRSPLSGIIRRIQIQPGSEVKKNDLVMVVEAMKMENKILAPKDGSIKSITVREDQQIQARDILFEYV